MYQIIKPLFFKLDPERAHDLTMQCMQFVSNTPFLLTQIQKFYGSKVPDLSVQCMGLDFRHPIGLAAGLDKDARALPAFSALGFSAVELGTVTPKPQPGNEKPRMFRLPEQQAIINRMGFNSGGVEPFLQNLLHYINDFSINGFSHAQSLAQFERAVVGVNIGKNAQTAIADAHFDYVSALQRVYNHADYITVNISSPNTKSLRDLQNANFLDDLLSHIKQAHDKCQKVHGRLVPVALKVAPDLDESEIETIAELLITHKFDGLIATNTTISRPDYLPADMAAQAGGLSGAPVKDLSTRCIAEFYKLLKGKVPIIGAGGIANTDDAWEKLLAGADFLQVYSLLIYQGPEMVQEIVTGLQKKVQQNGFTDIRSAMNELRQ